MARVEVFRSAQCCGVRGQGHHQRDDWIAYVSHDDEDGSWQFHNSEPGPVEDGDIMIVSLQNVVKRDESILELADLPEGWHARRSSKSSPWQRAKSRPVGVNDSE